MKVRVSPPYEGAGSFEGEAYLKREGEYRMEFGGRFPESWCKPIPEVKPEPGDIVEVWDEDPSRSFIRVFVRRGSPCFIAREWNGIHDVTYDNCRVLARKVKGFEDALTDVQDFYCALGERKADDYKQAAYDRFISAILGVEYARIDK